MGRFRDLFSPHAEDHHHHQQQQHHKDSGLSRDPSHKVNDSTSSLGRASSVVSTSSSIDLPEHARKEHPRFQLIGDTHEHHLRSARRRERLRGLFKELINRKKAEEEADAEELDHEAAEAVQYENTHHAKPPSLLYTLLEDMRENGEGDPVSALNHLLEASHSPSETVTSRYGTISVVLGKGSFGTVRLAEKIEGVDSNGKPRKLIYAVKEFSKNHNETQDDFMRRLTSEYCLSSSLHHPNVIESLDLIKDDRGQFCGVMEYCAGGDLYSLIVAVGTLDAPEADCFFKQMLRGVRYMHDMGIAHRDLKPENILLTSRGSIKITDFGNAECFRMVWEREIHLSSSVYGSGPYMAPEVFSEKPYDPRQADSWSLGVIYLAMRTGRHLWHIAKDSDPFYSEYISDRKQEYGYEIIEHLESSKRRNVIYSILDPSPSRRLTPKQVLKSEWGRSIVVCEAGDGHRESKMPSSINKLDLANTMPSKDLRKLLTSESALKKLSLDDSKSDGVRNVSPLSVQSSN